STIEGTSSAGLSDNLVRISLNAFHTFRPYLFPGEPDSSPLRLLTDRAFTFYQENLLGGIGSVNAYVVIWIIGAALLGNHSRMLPRERRFWSAFVPITLIIGIAVDGETSPSGVANICLQPLVYLAVTLVAARYVTFGRTVRLIVWFGLVVDLIFGI